MIRKTIIAASMIAICGPVAAGAIFEDVPDAVICKIEATADRPAADVVYFIFGQLEDGRISYHSAGKGRAALMVDVDGMVVTENLGNCSGETLDKLTENGQTRNF